MIEYRGNTQNILDFGIHGQKYFLVVASEKKELINTKKKLNFENE
jgi:hypothetical protein